jgi:hypothetical protein
VLGKFFGRKDKTDAEKVEPAPGASPARAPDSGQHPWTGQPDEIACNFALGHLYHNLKLRLTVDERIHAETLVAAAGAVAGFAAQRALFARIAATRDEATLGQLQLVTTASGATYVFGEPLNQSLFGHSNAEAPERLWPHAAGGAVAAGLSPDQLPDLSAMFAHVSRVLGGAHEGLPSVPQRPHLPARELLKGVWPVARMCFTGSLPGSEASARFGPASRRFWPAIAAHAAGSLIREVGPVLDPRSALVIAMESAIYASKLDPATIDPAEPALAAAPPA